MERKLKNLFDYQKFRGNARLEAMLADVEQRYGNAISDDDLSAVSAAGDLYSIHAREASTREDTPWK